LGRSGSDFANNRLTTVEKKLKDLKDIGDTSSGFVKNGIYCDFEEKGISVVKDS
jgi:hypothetical protein